MASENLYVSLESFRCFAKAERIRIAPVTILVGENSTGKTSFLAALRRIFESFSYPQANAFNREPYFLGSFEQISHYRGGKAGRAKTFCLEIEIEPASGQPDLFSEKKRKRPESLKYKVKFSKGRSQPAVSGFEIVFANIFASFEMANSKVIINVKKDGIDLIQSLNVDVSDTLVLMDPIYISYFLNDFARRARTGHDIDDEQAKVMEQISSAFSKASRQMRKRMFASAPVRIQPRRVYTPSELTGANAGEQVPLQMANQKLVSPLAWRATKAKLVEFGSRSGLFEDIDVKRFGKSDGDPFQLQVKNLGPAANIVDVGYGVSQALPLIYPLYADKDVDLFLLQQPEVHLHPRAQAEFGSLIVELCNQNPDKHFVIETHSDFIIDRIRSAVKSGLIDSEFINIVYFKKKNLEVEIFEISVGNDGSLMNYPEHYRDFFLSERARVLGV